MDTTTYTENGKEYREVRNGNVLTSLLKKGRLFYTRSTLL
jgi:hypothetical protein